MSNPLVVIREALDITDDAFEVARACAGLGYAQGVAGTQFEPPDPGYADTLKEFAKSELDDLIVLAMAASFEAHLKAFLQSRLKATPGANAAKIEKWLAGQIESSPLRDIGAVFSPAVTPVMIRDLEAVRTYRNWVAHGRMTSRRPSRDVTPSLAFSILTGFMAAAGII
ncbi:MAG: hypothetical protein NTW86_21660 [Candidatus Sumerlaeota bacterium]|nr:hypothetical protein [Candidatus Sumerlaeota bacterium]